MTSTKKSATPKSPPKVKSGAVAKPIQTKVVEEKKAVEEVILILNEEVIDNLFD